MDAILFTLPQTSPHICNEFSLPNLARAIVTLASTRMLSFMFVFFRLKLEPRALIKAWSVSKLNLVCRRNIFNKKTPKKLIIHISNYPFIFHMLQTLDGMFTNSKNNNALIIIHCVIATHCNETTCAITWWMAIIKIQPLISCAYTHPICFFIVF